MYKKVNQRFEPKVEKRILSFEDRQKLANFFLILAQIDQRLKKEKKNKVKSKIKGQDSSIHKTEINGGYCCFLFHFLKNNFAFLNKTNLLVFPNN